ncbi:DUF7683 domain-containing protein [Pectobacterium fontis]|uniref:DUF7683 domain-containing protein n=1 Tax=Pectobacterium fontis TaxID=2558042 RepID=A0A7V8L6A5_9GAMM|nr:hypothetical protein [Pectobacterium fontis]KHN51883.1 hypothetical protein OI69_09455 [Pectobacterium fontis]
MIVYSVEIYDKITEDIVREINIPKSQIDEIAKIMKWQDSEKKSFIKGVGGFDLTTEQAMLLEKLLGEDFFSEDVIIQISGGNI